MKKDVVRQWVNLLAVFALVILNILANALPFNGQNTGEISDRFEVFFVPAGYVFSIWGLIYIGLIAFGVYQVLPAQRENPRLRHVGYWFVLSCLANIAWLFLWHYNQFPLTLVVMLILLVCLIIVYTRLEIGHSRVSRTEFWTVQVPFSVYLGWVSVATIANASDVLYYIGWSGWGVSAQAWAAIMLIVATILGGLMAWRRADAAYLLVFVWAFIGIALKQAATPSVAYTAWVAALLTAGLAGYAIIHRKTLLN